MSGPEDKAREQIDQMLRDSGWIIQDYKELDLGEGLGVTIREYPFSMEASDYALFVDRQPVGVIEAKPQGWTLTGVTNQSDGYIEQLHKKFPNSPIRPPLSYESTGTETLFVNRRDPKHRSRNVFTFHTPETLKGWMNEATTLRHRLKQFPTLDHDKLYLCQIEAIKNLEESFADDRPRALIQMATGTGKTITAVTFIYRLLKFANAKRVLFLVDRSQLGRQALAKFEEYKTPDDGRNFTDLYNVQHLQSQTIDGASSVVISTIQRLYSILQGKKEFDKENDELSNFEDAPDSRQVEIRYNHNIPIEEFDFIVVDECHRSIYNKWKQVLDYFDAHIIGLTATPSKYTIGFFNNNQIMEYPHERAIADRINVGYEVYRIKTRISTQGGLISAGMIIEKRDKMTRKERSEITDEDISYTPNQLDRDVVAPDQIRTVIRTFKDKLFTEIFPRRTMVPKTLVYAKNDSHAEDITKTIRQEFGEGNEFCKKITYKTTGDKLENLIKDFRTSKNPRIAVTVDMIATGTDIRPLECIIFMRDVRSRIYFDQMKGRGTRVIKTDDLRAVTSDAKVKDHFIIVDAVGVCESAKTDTHSLNKKIGVSLEELMRAAAEGRADEKMLSTLAYRMSRLNIKLEDKDREEIKKEAGMSVQQMINKILDGVDTDMQVKRACNEFKTESPTNDQLKDTTKKSINDACNVFSSAKLRRTILDVKKRREIIIDPTLDGKPEGKFDEHAREQSTRTVQSFKDFLDKHRDELTALSVIYSKPYNVREITYNDIKNLADAMKKPPYELTPERLWVAYTRLEKSKVKGTPKDMLTSLISIVRFSIQKDDQLLPFEDVVDEKFAGWLAAQKSSGKEFSPEQMDWLIMIKDHIATSLSITLDDLELLPFTQRGGRVKLYQIFGNEYEAVLKELHQVLVRQ